MPKFRNRHEKPDALEFEQEPDDYGSVVALVQQLGSTAVEQFVDELSPYLDAVQHREKDAAERLATHLHGYAISAAIVIQAGGAAEFNRKIQEKLSMDQPIKTPQEVLDDLRQLA